MTGWHLVREGRCPSKENMERDLNLFRSVMNGSRQGVFRIYNWDEPAITTGHHQKKFTPHDPTLVIPIVPRPTGGGAVLHLDDLTFSISAPGDSPFPGGVTGACRAISGIFARAMKACGLDVEMRGDSTAFSPVCFMRSSPVELCIRGKKILGMAVFRKSGFLLVQGVIPLRVDTDLAPRVFGEPPDVEGLCDLFPGFDPEALADELMCAFPASPEIPLP
jgi:lipoyl(octanoyl) transferase